MQLPHGEEGADASFSDGGRADLARSRSSHAWVMVGFGGSGRSVLVTGEWAVGQWIVGVMSFQKMYGLISLKHQIRVAQVGWLSASAK